MGTDRLVPGILRDERNRVFVGSRVCVRDRPGGAGEEVNVAEFCRTHDISRCARISVAAAAIYGVTGEVFQTRLTVDGEARRGRGQLLNGLGSPA